MINIYTEFILSSVSGTCIEGTMLIPYDNGVFYKPYAIKIIDGNLDLMHRFNTGIHAKQHRDYKEEIIKKYFKIIGNTATLIKPFEYNFGKQAGAVSFASNMLGMRTNRECSLKFLNTDFLDKYKIPKLFQNAKRVTDNIFGKIVHINELEGQVSEDLQNLVNLYYENINTSIMKIKELKNGR